MIENHCLPIILLTIFYGTFVICIIYYNIALLDIIVQLVYAVNN